MSARLLIERIERTTVHGEVETLEFGPGVNIIVGPQNTGKTTWLRMLDYLMADDGSPAEKFDEAIIEKYRGISATLRLNERVLKIERIWQEGGARSVNLVDGERVSLDGLQVLLFQELKMPLLRYPQGNVYTSDRKWPTLGWRSLYRHVYRRQDCWGELIPKQPDSEQQACLLQFLGLAEHLFSEDYANLVEKQKRVSSIQHRKDYFVELMGQLASGIISENELSVGLTQASIDVAVNNAQESVSSLVSQRTSILANIQEEVSPGPELANLMDARSASFSTLETLRKRYSEIQVRIAETEKYKQALGHEIERLDRADAAAGIFDAIRVTHCPACDQPVHDRSHAPESCFLCGQAIGQSEGSSERGLRRLNFERDQIAAELAEADDLLKAAAAERDSLAAQMRDAESEIRRLTASLRPFQARASGILPEGVAIIDQQIGALNTRIDVLHRLGELLKSRDALTRDVDALLDEIRALEAKISVHEAGAELEKASDRLTDGFNTYLNALRARDAQSWTKSNPVIVRVSERRTQYFIGTREAKNQLGGTLTLFFLLAYQYALLSLAPNSDCHYPGISVLDLFPDITKGDQFRESLAMVIEPFVRLADAECSAEIQVIIASREFPATGGVRKLELTEVWR